MGNRQRRKFWTGLITLGHEEFQPDPQFRGAGWHATLSAPKNRPHVTKGGKEVILHASTWSTAQRALDLIHGCRLLIQGPDVIGFKLVAHNREDPVGLKEHERELIRQTLSTTDIPRACAIAAKASRRRMWVYGVAKYKFSLGVQAVHIMDLEPWHSPHLPVSSFPDDHVRFSHAIVAAHSVLEDLGLEIRATAQNPSRIKGKWNSVVKQDLEDRLIKAGVDLKEQLLWTVRGPKRKIETIRPIPPGRRAPWSAWIIRDTEIPIVDAIARADWLRDKIASHSVKDLTRSLSPYDVENVQHLARRLLLETLGFWRYWEKTEK
jgi:hypothetical protein